MAMYAGIPNDPRIGENEDRLTAATLNGATQAAYEAGIPLPTTLTQRASDIARAEEQNQINHDLTSFYAQAEFNQRLAQALSQPQTQQQSQQPEQQAPVLTQGLMPGFGEGATYQAGYIPGQEQAEPQQPQTLTQMARQKALDIINAKNLWAQGEAMGGEQGAQVMQLAHAGAERARGDLQQLGVDPAQYGLNGTYEEAAQGLASNDIRAMQNTLEGEWAESSGSYYDRVYKILRDNGFSRDIAEDEARRRAQSYASQRVQALNQAFNTYGHNGQVINPMGIQMLGMMAQEDTDMANYYTQRYAGPLQEYAKQNARENAAIQHRYKGEDRAEDQKNRLQAMGYQAQLNDQLAARQAERAEAQAQRNWTRAIASREHELKLRAALGLGTGKGSQATNGVTKDQAHQADERIKRNQKLLTDRLDMSVDERKKIQAQIEADEAIINAFLGYGQQGGKQLDPANNYDDFIEYYTDIYDKNSKTGEFSNEQIYADAVKMNPEWAKDIPEAYRKKVEKENSANNSATNTSSAPPSSSDTGKSSGIYDWIVGKLLSKPTLNVKSSDPSRLW